MHPAVRVLMLVAFAAMLGSLSLAALAVLLAMLLLVYLRRADHALPRLRAGVMRMRWLLLAIFVLYGGFTPGTPLVDALPGLSREGLLEGSRRALVLVDLLVMVYLLVAVTPIADLVAALQLLLRPLALLGVDNRRIALRLALALDAVGDMQARLRALSRGRRGWSAAAAMVEDIERQAERPGDTVSVPTLRAVHWWEWLLPISVVAGLGYWMP